MIGLITSVVNYEIDIDQANFVAYNEDEMKIYPDPMLNPRNNNKWTNMLRTSVLFTSLLSIYMNYLRYRCKVQWLKIYYNAAKSEKTE